MISGSLGVIPARLGSSRLPRKPLYPLCDRPLIEWVWRRVVAADVFEAVVVATDSREVADVVRGFGGEVELTDPGHPSGTDRVAEVARLARYGGFPVVVNVQGDEPLIRGADLQRAAALVANGDSEIGTLAALLTTLQELYDPAVVKVVRGNDGRALFFSRAPIPFPRDSEPGPADLAGGHFLRHIGVYSYRRDALLRWVSMPEAELERIERLEQLRPLAAGMSIGIALVPPVDGGVDTPADVERVEQRLREIHDMPGEIRV